MLVYLQKMNKACPLGFQHFRAHIMPLADQHLRAQLKPLMAIDTLIPASMSYKLGTNNQTFINRKEVIRKS
jgi:hypothetical protein